MRMDASICIILPAAGVKVFLLSMRAEVHTPEADLRGMNCTVLPPEIWTLLLEVV
jgi:hypothetical protein